MWFKNLVKSVRRLIKMAHEKVYGICENKCAVEVEPKNDTGWLTIAEADGSGVSQGTIKVTRKIECRRIGKLIYFRGVFSVTRATQSTTRSFPLPEEIKSCISTFYEFFGNASVSTTREIYSTSKYVIDNGFGGLTLRENLTQSGVNNSASNITYINCVVPVDEQ